MIGFGLVVRRPGEQEPIVSGGGREPLWVIAWPVSWLCDRDRRKCRWNPQKPGRRRPFVIE
jgi:hypothetical protein